MKARVNLDKRGTIARREDDNLVVLKAKPGDVLEYEGQA